MIAKQIEGIQKMIRLHDGPQEEGRGLIQINPVMKRHWELEIKTLQEAPRDADKLRRIFKSKQREWEDTMKIDDLERIVTEMEMLRFVVCSLLLGKSR
jgi:cystathionine beta-lyase family protein involved in aluminum resistance